jgi:hypothetical protein
MTAERTPPPDEDEVGLILALTLPLIGRSDPPDAFELPAEFSAHLSAFDLPASEGAVASGVSGPPRSR